MPSPSQDTIACTCPSCGNLFAVKASFLGRQVKCPICTASVTARQEERPSREPLQHPRAGRLKLQRKRPEIRNNRLFRHLPPVFRTLPRTPLRIHRSHQRKRRTDGPFPFTGLPLRAPINPRQKSVKGKRETPLRPLPRHAAPPWPRKNRNTALPPRTPCTANPGPLGIYGFLSRDWFFPFWACSCSCAGGIWKRKTPNF